VWSFIKRTLSTKSIILNVIISNDLKFIKTLTGFSLPHLSRPKILFFPGKNSPYCDSQIILVPPPLPQIKSWRRHPLLMLIWNAPIWLSSTFIFLAKVVKSFVIYSPSVKKCIKAIPPRTVKLEGCRYDDAFHWRWATDGQVQNVKTGLCVEINDYAIYMYKHTNMHLALCNYRKKLQVCINWLLASNDWNSPFPSFSRYDGLNSGN
jgi:hypothetical protein